MESELEAGGLTRHACRWHFGTPAKLDQTAREEHPQVFWDIPLAKVIEAEPDLSKFKRFIVTTVVAGCRVHEPFFRSLEYYAKKHKAKIIVLACSDPAASVSPGGFGTIDKMIDTSPYATPIGADILLHKHLTLRTIKTSAKQLDPTTGMRRLGRRGGSCIYASPKQRLEFVPATTTGKLPHAVMTTGAVTRPNYQSGLYMSQRLAYLADHDHIMGAVIVELDGDLFHFRQVQMSPDGSFCDLGIRYSADSDKLERPAAMVWGDTHVGATDPEDEKARREMVKQLKPLQIFIHDLFDGRSISHHELNRSITRARSTEELPLHSELGKVADYLKSWLSDDHRLVVVKSNHDEWLDRYVEECRFKDDPRNYGVGLKLALALYEGKDPLSTAMSWHDVKGVRFLGRRDSVRVAKIELGQHGDKGPNGGASSLAGMEQAYGACVIGHAHSPAILRGVYRVGTSTRLDLGYNIGPSSWFNTHALVYADGSRQLINTIGGRWRI